MFRKLSERTKNDDDKKLKERKATAFTACLANIVETMGDCSNTGIDASVLYDMDRKANGSYL